MQECGGGVESSLIEFRLQHRRPNRLDNNEKILLNSFALVGYRMPQSASRPLLMEGVVSFQFLLQSRRPPSIAHFNG
jgi:hypothetical protein